MRMSMRVRECTISVQVEGLEVHFNPLDPASHKRALRQVRDWAVEGARRLLELELVAATYELQVAEPPGDAHPATCPQAGSVITQSKGENT